MNSGFKLKCFSEEGAKKSEALLDLLDEAEKKYRKNTENESLKSEEVSLEPLDLSIKNHTLELQNYKSAIKMNLKFDIRDSYIKYDSDDSDKINICEESENSNDRQDKKSFKHRSYRCNKVEESDDDDFNEGSDEDQDEKFEDEFDNEYNENESENNQDLNDDLPDFQRYFDYVLKEKENEINLEEYIEINEEDEKTDIGDAKRIKLTCKENE